MHNTLLHLLRRAVALLSLILLTLGYASEARAQESAQGPSIEDTRLMLDRWIEARQTIAKEKTEWALAKQVMLDRIDIMKQSIEDVEQQIEERRELLSGFDDNIAELEAKNQSLKDATEKMAELIESMEARTVLLLGRAPVPLVEQVKPLAVQLPGYHADKRDPSADKAVSPVEKSSQNDSAVAPADTPGQDQMDDIKIPLSRRVENVVGVLYLFNRFAGKIDQTSELVEQPDGSSLSVDTVYLGLSYGYFVDQATQIGASGWGSPDGWVWDPIEQPDVAARIRQAISVYNKDEPAAYVTLPVEVKD